MYGITGKILEINLSKNATTALELKENIYKNFLGGTGIAAKIFFDREIYKVDPLSPQNILMFMIGPLTGTNFPGVSRFEAVAKSPLTGIWGEASCGAGFGREIKLAGYDGIIISGASDKPVYILIDNDKVEIKDADDLWGKDTYEIDEYFTKLDKKLQVATIGPAGENLVKFSSITTDRGDHAARCGLGAVMGSKKLKCIAIKGSKKISISDQKRFDELRKKLNEKLIDDPLKVALNRYGTNSGMQLGAQVGDVPTKNFRVAVFQSADKIDGVAVTENILVKTKSCFACPIACKRVVKVDDEKYKLEEGPGPEYETAAALGSLILNDNLKFLAKLNEICNRYGIDTISTGNTIAWAMECYEKDIITKKETNGLDLKYGDEEAILTLINKIVKREGIGDLLAEGVRYASSKIGNGSEKFAMHIKGLEMPMHDPRSYHGLVLTYAMSSRGACHTHDMNLMIEMGASKYPEISIKGGYNPISYKDKTEVTIKSQNFGMIYSSSVMCYFVAAILSAKDITDMINAVTGWELTLDNMMEIGERIWYLKRGLNTLMGITTKDDDIPQRIKEPYIEGTLPGIEKLVVKMTATKPPKKIRKLANKLVYDRIFPKIKNVIALINRLDLPGRKKYRKNPFLIVPDFERMKKEFYKLRELDKEGKPKKEKLMNLGLKELAERI